MPSSPDEGDPDPAPAEGRDATPGTERPRPVDTATASDASDASASADLTPPDGPREAAPPDLRVADAGPADAPGAVVQRALDVDVLHEIAIEVAPQDLPLLDTGKDVRVPCRLVFDGVVLPMSGIRRKGLTTRSIPLSGKPSFSVKLDEFVPGQNLDGLRKIILSSGVHDPGFVNEHIGYWALRSVGLPAARTSHGIVTFNGAVKGIYVVKEGIDKQFLSRVFGAANRNGNLYEGSVVDFVLRPLAMELKNESEEMRKRDDMNDLSTAARSTADEQFANVMSTKMRLTDAITTYALNGVLSSWDSYWWGSNNYYLFDNPSDGKFLFISHGMDRLFAKLGTFGAGPPLPTADPFASAASYVGGDPGRFAARIRAIPALDRQYRAEVARMARVVWDVARLNALVDRVGVTLHSTKRTDAATVRDLAAFDRNTAALRDFFVKRKAYLDMVAR